MAEGRGQRTEEEEKQPWKLSADPGYMQASIMSGS